MYDATADGLAQRAQPARHRHGDGPAGGRQPGRTWKVKVATRGRARPSSSPTRRGPGRRPTPTSRSTCPRSPRTSWAAAGMVKSPRDLQDGTKDNLLLNLQDGLDHPLTTHPDIASVTAAAPRSTVASLLTTLNGPTGLFQCSNTTPAHQGHGGSLQNGLVPNCMVIQQGSSTYTEFTDGMLGAAAHGPGQLLHRRARAHQRRPPGVHDGPALPGGPDLDLTVGGARVPVNDDRFEDFVVPERKSLLTTRRSSTSAPTCCPGCRSLTPDSALEPDALLVAPVHVGADHLVAVRPERRRHLPGAHVPTGLRHPGRAERAGLRGRRPRARPRRPLGQDGAQHQPGDDHGIVHEQREGRCCARCGS